MRILGIDPGLNTTGYAVIEAVGAPRVLEAGIIKGAEGREPADMAKRLRALYDSLLEVIDQLTPAVLVVEQLYSHYEHPRTAILMAHARGVIFLAGANRNLPVLSYSATQIKKTITGNGRASKEQIQHAMLREFGLPKLPEPHDVSDALAVALCHHHLAGSGARVSGLGKAVDRSALLGESDPRNPEPGTRNPT
jgi:crossover junction endodeoxyribonuclease RuvC